MTSSHFSHEFHAESLDRLGARIETMDAAADPVPAPRSKTTSPGTLLLAIIVGCIVIATVGNWLHSQAVAFNDIIVKFFLVLIPVLFLAFGFFVVRFFGFLRTNRVEEQEALAEAEAEAMSREARFAAGRIKGDRRLCIRPLNPAKRAAKRRRRGDKYRTA